MIIQQNLYKASYDDLEELTCTAQTMGQAITVFAQNKDDEPTQIRRTVKGIKTAQPEPTKTLNVVVSSADAEQGAKAVPSTAEVTVGVPIRLYAVESDTASFLNWKDHEGNILSEEKEFDFLPTALMPDNITINCNFASVNKTVNVSISKSSEDIEAFAVPLTSNAKVGEKIHLYAIPTDTSLFVSWTKDGTVLSTDAEFEYTVEDSEEDEITITANFVGA